MRAAGLPNRGGHTKPSYAELNSVAKLNSLQLSADIDKERARLASEAEAERAVRAQLNTQVV
jgi:hypothetical protein